MRRLLIGLACLAAAGVVAPQTAEAQARVDAQELAASDPPTVLIHNDADGWKDIRATRVPGHPGAYTAAVVFPSGGAWTYHVHDPIAGGGYDFDPILVAAQGDSGGLHMWLLVGAAVVLVAAAAIVARRRQIA